MKNIATTCTGGAHNHGNNAATSNNMNMLQNNLRNPNQTKSERRIGRRSKSTIHPHTSHLMTLLILPLILVLLHDVPILHHNHLFVGASSNSNNPPPPPHLPPPRRPPPPPPPKILKAETENAVKSRDEYEYEYDERIVDQREREGRRDRGYDYDDDRENKGYPSDYKGRNGSSRSRRYDDYNNNHNNNNDDRRRRRRDDRFNDDEDDDYLYNNRRQSRPGYESSFDSRSQDDEDDYDERRTMKKRRESSSFPQQSYNYNDRRRPQKRQPFHDNMDDEYDDYDIDDYGRDEGRQRRQRPPPRLSRSREEQEIEEEEIKKATAEKKQKKSFFSSPFKRLGKEKMDIETNRKNIPTSKSSSSSSSSKLKFNPFSDNDDRKSNDSDSNNEEETSKYVPINYEFSSKKDMPRDNNRSKNNSKKDEEDDDMPDTGWMDMDNNTRKGNGYMDKKNMINDANPRRDEVTRYASTKMGKLKLCVSSITCGGMLGTFVGKSIFGGDGKQIAMIFAFLFWFMNTFLRNAYGEMTRSLALGFIYLLSRTRSVRKRYRTGIHLKAICQLGGGGRVPFPPINDEDGVENPWKYVPQSNDDPDFDMMKSLICLVMVGSFCGGNIPLIPTWMGSTAGAATFALIAIRKNSRGDLMRTMGMRVVATAREAIYINSELNVARKVSVVAGKLFDKAMILDRKHRIKDRLLKSASWAYGRVSSTVSNVKDEVNEDERRFEDSYQERRRERGRDANMMER